MTSSLISGSPIDGVELRKLTEHTDHRGSFAEVFQRHWGTCMAPVQWSVVKSAPQVFRGMHLHLRHDEYFSLLTGHAYVGLKDVRKGSPTDGVYALYELHADDIAAIIFPRGLLHGWYFLEPSIHLQAVSEAYADYHSDDNWGVYWNAADLGIPWPFKTATVSHRAGDFPTEAQLRQEVTAFLATRAKLTGTPA